MVAQDTVVVDSHNHALTKKVAHTTKIVRELQDISMSMRMVELKATFSKMARLARDVGRKLGKNVNFLTEGEETEIDRNLVDIVNDPLVHMVRNAVDHGIETPPERRAAGKPEQGTVKIAAYHSAGSVVVEISDDGKGLDREVLIAKARERGLISTALEVNERSLSDREVFNLIFEPGFSTAQVVTDVSGRGVGMDVVKKNIELLRGQVEIRSEKGRGSIFRMSLPLTLAIIDGMVIRVGTEIYVIPTVAIVRSVKPSPHDICTVFGQGEMLKLQGRLIPLHRISKIFGIDGGRSELSQAIVVVVEDEERQAGLVVDELVGRQQVVIKSLGETMKNIPGISGGAIMPDGRVGLILDVGGLLRVSNPERSDARRDEGALSPGLPMAA
jgi:two-component system chemotaxis sensor kinase CheA